MQTPLDPEGMSAVMPKGWMTIKSFKKGYEAGKAGKTAASCPYELQDDEQYTGAEVKKLLLKRYRWRMGWEEARYKAPPPGKKSRAVPVEKKKKKAK